MKRTLLVRSLLWLAGFSAAACVAAPGSSMAPRATLGPNSVRPVVARTYSEGGISIAAPPSGAVAATSVERAYDLCMSGRAECPDGPPDAVELASVTDSQYGIEQPNGSVTHTIQGRLAWVFSWDGADCGPVSRPIAVWGPTAPATAADGSPVASTPLICAWVVLIDAKTGDLLYSYSGPPAR